jgi:hypothetical protein
MLAEEKKRRNIPPLLPDRMISDDWETTRRRLVDLFEGNVYGVTPTAPRSVTSKVLKEDTDAFGGKAAHRCVSLSFDVPEGIFSFDIDTVVSNGNKKLPMFIFLSFHTYYESYETPVEEILDSGYALAVIHYETITADNEDMTSKLAGMFPRQRREERMGENRRLGILAEQGDGLCSDAGSYRQRPDRVRGAFEARQDGTVVLRAGYPLSGGVRKRIGVFGSGDNEKKEGGDRKRYMYKVSLVVLQ